MKSRFQTLALLLASGGLLPGPVLADAALDPASFASPPPGTRPMTWMHWMNGNASAGGMTKDLEALAAAGVGGALVFNIGRRIPEGDLRFNSDAYREIIAHSVREADRLGLTLGVHNCDGWSSSGGPWVTVEDSMKRVVWSETVVSAPGHVPVTAVLPAPLTQGGFHRDIAVVAYRATATEHVAARLVPTVSTSEANTEAGGLLDRSLDDTLRVRGADGWVQLSYPEPFPARSITIEHDSRHSTGKLLASDDGITFTPVTDFAKTRTGKNTWVFTATFPLTPARHFRAVFDSGLNLRHLDLAADPRLPGWLDRNSWGSGPDADLPTLPTDPAAYVPFDQVRVLDVAPAADGRVTATLPAGTWRIMRFGYTTTAAFNHPATDAGRGFECDKLDAAALDRHFAAYVGKLAEENRDLTGRVFRFSEIDSFEMGGQNWTGEFAAHFREAQGYDFTPFLPLLAGRLLGDPVATEAVLRDFRATVSTLMVENYFGRFTELCHAHGMLSYIEPYGFGPFDDLTAGGKADIPMGEFWLKLGSGTVFKAAVSAARIYGKPIVSAESFTSWADLNWKAHPHLMKFAGDYAWTQGINEMMFHRFAHQANPHVSPGMTMGDVGSHLDRTQTWWLNAGAAWFRYLQRGQHLLRQGVPVSDVLLYVGEASPHDVPEDYQLKPALPNGYQFDACDTEVLLNRLVVAPDGRLVLPEGTSYRVLALQNSAQLSLRVLRRLGELAAAGAIIAGPRPVSPLGYRELQHHRAEFTALADELWGPTGAPFNSVGAGRIYPELAWSRIFADLALVPDCVIAGDAVTAFTHRRLADGDVYFVLSRADAPRTARLSFRVGDLRPERWYAETGDTETLASFTRTADGRTELTLDLPAQGSAFIVFRDPVDELDPVVGVSHGGSALPRADYDLTVDAEDRLTLRTATAGTFALARASGRTTEVWVPPVPEPLSIAGPWQVGFDPEWGGPAEITFPTLTDWMDHADEGIRHYSGSATYRQTFAVPADWLRADRRVMLDLGQVEIAAEVTINGRAFRTLWEPPFRLDVTDALREGDNVIAVRVTNLWTNRLIGDEAIPRTDGYVGVSGGGAFTGSQVMPDWYVANQPPPAGDRFTFTTFNFHQKDRVSVPSGLLGPVRLAIEAVVGTN